MCYFFLTRSNKNLANCHFWKYNNILYFQVITINCQPINEIQQIGFDKTNFENLDIDNDFENKSNIITIDNSEDILQSDNKIFDKDLKLKTSTEKINEIIPKSNSDFEILSKNNNLGNYETSLKNQITNGKENEILEKYRDIRNCYDYRPYGSRRRKHNSRRRYNNYYNDHSDSEEHQPPPRRRPPSCPPRRKRPPSTPSKPKNDYVSSDDSSSHELEVNCKEREKNDNRNNDKYDQYW